MCAIFGTEQKATENECLPKLDISPEDPPLHIDKVSIASLKRTKSEPSLNRINWVEIEELHNQNRVDLSSDADDGDSSKSDNSSDYSNPSYDEADLLEG